MFSVGLCTDATSIALQNIWCILTLLHYYILFISQGSLSTPQLEKDGQNNEMKYINVIGQNHSPFHFTLTLSHKSESQRIATPIVVLYGTNISMIKPERTIYLIEIPALRGFIAKWLRPETFARFQLKDPPVPDSFILFWPLGKANTMEMTLLTYRPWLWVS